MIARSTRQQIDKIVNAIAQSPEGMRFCDLAQALPEIDTKRMSRLLERVAFDPRVQRTRVYKAGPGGIYRFTIKPDAVVLPTQIEVPAFSVRRYVQDWRVDEIEDDRETRATQTQNLAKLEYLRGLYIDGNTHPMLQEVILDYRRLVGLEIDQ